MYLDDKGNVINGKSLYPTTPWACRAPWRAWTCPEKWGTMPLDKVIAPAIALAEKGFPVSETLAKILRQEQKNMGKWPPPPRFLEDGAP